ncbi:MAG TPA: hypothetical protein VLL52_10590 [Anaerolineae bacterium]|nr:hypothetical protein [Anaerolineae bacterium]
MLFISPIDLVKFARQKAPYYQRLYAHLPPEFDWSDVPIIDKELFWEEKRAQPNDFITQSPFGGYVWSTGGSTSQGNRVHISNEDFAEECRFMSLAFTAAGLSHGDVVANLFHSGNLYASFLLTSQCLQLLPVTQLPILSHPPIARVVELCQEFSPNAILAPPTTLLKLANYCKRHRITLNIEKLLYAGEHLYPDQRQELIDRFGSQQIRGFGYAAVDTGPIAAPVLAAPDRTYQPLNGYTYVELLDDYDEPIIQPGQRGRLVITNLGRRLSPVIRYPIGDIGEWSTPAGPQGPFRLHERSNLSFKFGRRIIFYHELRRIAQNVPGFTSNIQIIVDRQDGRSTANIHVRPDLDGRDPQDAIADFQEKFWLEYGDPTYAFIEENNKDLIQVHLTDLEKFIFSPQSGKPIPIIDRRKL